MSGEHLLTRIVQPVRAAAAALAAAAWLAACSSGGGGGGSNPAATIRCIESPNCEDTLASSHRGSYFFAPENTIAAFALGVEQGADIIESDVRRSLDGVLVMMHDSTVDRVTNGAGPIENKTYEEIRALLVLPPNRRGYIDDAYAFLRLTGLTVIVPEPQPVPTLGETLEFLDGKALLDLDINVEDADLEQVVEEVSDTGHVRDVLFLAESVEKAERIRAVAPAATLLARPANLAEAEEFFARFPPEELPLIHINPDDPDFAAVAARTHERRAKLFVNSLGTWDVLASLAETDARRGGSDPLEALNAARTVYQAFVTSTTLDIIQTDRMDIVGLFVDDLNLQRKVGGSASSAPRGFPPALKPRAPLDILAPSGARETIGRHLR